MNRHYLSAFKQKNRHRVILLIGPLGATMHRQTLRLTYNTSFCDNNIYLFYLPMNINCALKELGAWTRFAI